LPFESDFDKRAPAASRSLSSFQPALGVSVIIPFQGHDRESDRERQRERERERERERDQKTRERERESLPAYRRL
jgi:hypothetical protein